MTLEDPSSWPLLYQILGFIFLGGGALGGAFGIRKYRNGRTEVRVEIDVPLLLERSVISQERTTLELERSTDVQEQLTGAMLEISEQMTRTDGSLGYLVHRERGRQKQEQKDTMEAEIRAEIEAEMGEI